MKLVGFKTPATSVGDPRAGRRLSPLVSLLRCLECGSALRLERLDYDGAYPDLGPDGVLSCSGCSGWYPIIGGTPRMFRVDSRSHLAAQYPDAARSLGLEASPAAAATSEAAVKRRTADSFAYEWERFGTLREEWRKNFLDYLQPHPPEFFAGRLVLDVGTGSGRHSHQAAELGAEVVAVDIGRSIDVARRNLPDRVLTVQADAESLPFAAATFDLVMSIGVLHHLPAPERAFRAIAPLARPGAYIQVYLYWVPPRRSHQRVLGLVTAVRRVTTQLPHRLLLALCYPLAAALALAVVSPYRRMRNVPRLDRFADALPLKTYADYPFGVLVNDQFDRFSAPIENRYAASEVERWLKGVGLEQIEVRAHHGWVASGRQPATGPSTE